MKTHIFTIQRMQTRPTMKNVWAFIFNVISNLSFYRVLVQRTHYTSTLHWKENDSETNGMNNPNCCEKNAIQVVGLRSRWWKFFLLVFFFAVYKLYIICL